MGRAAFTLGGTLIGGLIPGVGQIGAAIGGIAGGLLGSVLFPPPTQYGPRMDDTGIAPGTYGSPMGMPYGMSDMACDLIWVEGNRIKERKNKQTAGGKGGQKYVTYEYFASFALLISDRPITGLRRLWFGKELVYDGTSENLTAAIGGSPTVNGVPLTGSIEGLQFRLYTGTSDQQPDPLIQAEDANAPAWRGMAYIVVEDLPLERFGNGIPGDRLPVIAEVTTADPVYPTFAMDLYDFSSTQGRYTAFDPARGRLIAQKGNSDVHVYDVATGLLERIDNPAGVARPYYLDIFAPSINDLPGTFGGSVTPRTTMSEEIGPIIAPDGSFYIIDNIIHGDSVTGATGILMDAETGVFLGEIGQSLVYTSGGAHCLAHGTSDATKTPCTWHIVREVDWLQPNPLTGVQPFLYMRACENGFLYFGPVSAGDRGAIEIGGFADISDWTAATHEFMCDVNQAGDRIYVVYRTTSGGNVKAGYIPISGIPTGAVDPAGADAYTIATTINLTTASLDPGELSGCVWNEDAETFTVIGATGFVILDSDLAVVASDVSGWNVQEDAGGYMHMHNIDEGSFYVTSGTTATGDEADTVRKFATDDGTLEETLDLTDWGLTDATTLTSFWPYRSDVYVAHSNTRPRLLYGPRFGVDKITLASVLLDLAKRSGLTDSDLDLTGVSRLIYGAPQKGANVTARGAWEDLLLLTDHYATIIDGVLTVLPRETSATGTLTDVDLGPGETWALKRKTDSSIPARRVEVNYKSVPAQLEPANQADEFPVDVLDSGRVIKIDTALRMDDDEAWGATQRILADASSERTEMEIALPYTRGDIEAGEIWNVTSNGATYPMRIGEIAGHRKLTFEGRAAYPFLSPAGTPIDSTRDAPTLAELAVTEFALIDAHLLRDEDSSGAFTVAAWPRRASLDWGGGVILRGPDALTQNDEIATITAAATMGVATNALGDVVSADFWDHANTINVRMISGAPESSTEALVLNGANPLWIFCGSTGEVEVVQYTTATEEADGSYTLSGLLRGRRGTEHLTGSHTIGDRVVWADAATARRVGGSQIGTELWYISGTIGSNPSLTTRRTFTNNGRGLRPYSVVQCAISRDGSSNITGTAVRRSRIHGLDTIEDDPPLGEASEAYEVDVMNGSTVARAITGLSSPSFSYTAAEQTTDFGSPQASVTVRWYQISETVGRGVVKEFTG